MAAHAAEGPGRASPPRIGRRAVITAGAAATLAAALAGCSDLFADDDTAEDDLPTGPTDDVASVIVVGAGAAGMSAAALLTRAGVDVRVLEARSTHGGRMRHDLSFADFPIPLGAEWLHEDAAELASIADDAVAPDETTLIGYRADDEVAYYDGTLVETVMGADVDGDLKFVGTSWLGFFETWVLPTIADRITYGTEVVEVAETDGGVRLTDADGVVHEADATIVTVPLKLLQDERLSFDPPLPDSIRDAIADADIWGGIKVFVEFSERFYPVFLAFPDSDTPTGQRLYYDAAYGQATDRHVLGLFAVGEAAARYQGLGDDQLLAAILGELDEVFEGAASTAYVAHIVQDWNDEPFAAAAYLGDHADWRLPPRLQERFSERVLLAGDAITSHDDWSAVDDAARSARDAVRDLLG